MAFAGVEFGDALLFLISLIAGFILGRWWGLWGYLGLPIAGYITNKSYLTWKANVTPGQFRQWLFELGIFGYSKAFSSQKTIFIGDGKVINRGAATMNNRILESAQGENDGNQRSRKIDSRT